MPALQVAQVALGYGIQRVSVRFGVSRDQVRMPSREDRERATLNIPNFSITRPRACLAGQIPRAWPAFHAIWRAEALSLSDDEKVTSQQKTEVLVPTNAKPAGWTHSKVPWLWQETMNKNAWTAVLKMVNAGSVINLSPSLVLVRCIAWLQTQATRA